MPALLLLATRRGDVLPLKDAALRQALGQAVCRQEERRHDGRQRRRGISGREFFRSVLSPVRAVKVADAVKKF